MGNMKLAAQQKVFNFPEQLKAAREYAGVSQRQVALEIGIKPQSLYDFEKGKKNPSLVTTAHLFQYFKKFQILFELKMN